MKQFRPERVFPLGPVPVPETASHGLGLTSKLLLREMRFSKWETNICQLTVFYVVSQATLKAYTIPSSSQNNLCMAPKGGVRNS